MAENVDSAIIESDSVYSIQVVGTYEVDLQPRYEAGTLAKSDSIARVDTSTPNVAEDIDSSLKFRVLNQEEVMFSGSVRSMDSEESFPEAPTEQELSQISGYQNQKFVAEEEYYPMSRFETDARTDDTGLPVWDFGTDDDGGFEHDGIFAVNNNFENGGSLNCEDGVEDGTPPTGSPERVTSRQFDTEDAIFAFTDDGARKQAPVGMNKIGVLPNKAEKPDAAKGNNDAAISGKQSIILAKEVTGEYRQTGNKSEHNYHEVEKIEKYFSDIVQQHSEGHYEDLQYGSRGSTTLQSLTESRVSNENRQNTTSDPLSERDGVPEVSKDISCTKFPASYPITSCNPETLALSEEPVKLKGIPTFENVLNEPLYARMHPMKASDPELPKDVIVQPKRPRYPSAGASPESMFMASRDSVENGGKDDFNNVSREEMYSDNHRDKMPAPVSPERQNRVAPEQAKSFGERRDSSGDVNERDQDGDIGFCGYILWILSLLVICLTFPISLCLCIKVVQEYERAVIFRLGRLLTGGARGPGLFFIVPCVDAYSKVDLRTVSFDVPPQEVLTKDSVTVAVDAVVYYRVSNATISVTNVEDANRSTRLLAQTTLRNVLGTKNLSEILSDREQISNSMQDSLDVATDPWGIKVERVEVKDVRLPVQLQRAMAAEAEAARDARAKVIAAEGEQKASRALKEAADVITESPAALQLRYLQTLNAISAEKNSTIIFPLPIDMMQAFLHR